jgi:hypothetical protein
MENDIPIQSGKNKIKVRKLFCLRTEGSFDIKFVKNKNSRLMDRATLMIVFG